MKKGFFKQLLIPLGLVTLNFFLILPWFAKGFAPFGASIEPVVIAQARFIKNNWPNISWYPYWYLGFPFRLAGSPFLPYLLALMGTLFPGLSLWFGYRLVTGIGLVIMPAGVYWLSLSFISRRERKGVQSQRASAFLAALIFILLPSILFLFPQVFAKGKELGFFPWQHFSLAYLGNGPKILSLALLPFCLLVFDHFLKNELKNSFWFVFLVCVLALVDLSSLVSLGVLVGLLLVSYAMTGKLGGKLKKTLLVLSFAFCTLSFYYTPRFWFQILSAPSLAGKRAFPVALFLTRTLSLLVAMVLGVFSAKFLKKKREKAFLFAFLWFFVFGILTIVRFLADYDFWQDYTSWGVELGMGIALFATQLLTGPKLKINPPTGGEKLKIIGVIVVILFSSLNWLGKRKILLLPRQKIDQTIEYRITQWLNKNVSPGERVFLSGSPVFWFNSLSANWRIAQVRGGDDKAANHPWWDHAAYQIRVGKQPDLTSAWLKALGSSWIVVHDFDSEEPYHDFIYPEKFKTESFQEVWQEKGDKIYKLSDTGLVREINKVDTFLKIKPPRNGADLEALANYDQHLDTLIPFSWINSEELILKPKSNQAIGLAISFDSLWQARQGGQRLKMKKDALGQIVIFPENRDEIRLKYARFSLDQFIGVWISLSTMIWFISRKPKTKGF